MTRDPVREGSAAFVRTDAESAFTALDTAERRDVASRSATRVHRRTAIELPTLGIVLLTYVAWLSSTLAYHHASLWLVAPITALLITLHGSLQHEIVHRHPTRWNGVNRLFGIVPLALWMPFERYRQTHLAHHCDARLTDPVDDPESYYWTADDWARRSAFSRAMLRAQQTLAGRVLLGSFWRIGLFLGGELRGLRLGQGDLRAAWAEHLIWCVPVVLWVKFICGIPLTLYIAAMVIPANGVMLIRSFAEHRARDDVRERVALVEGSWLLGPLFLFNNLHALHHEAPGIPWYEYNARYRTIRARLIEENDGLVYRSYFEVARRYLFRSHDSVLHPTDRVPTRP